MLFLLMVSFCQMDMKTEAEVQGLYPKVSISGSGTLDSNVTGIRVKVAFAPLAGNFTIEQHVQIPYFNVTGTGKIYNISGSFTVEAKSQDVAGTFVDAIFNYSGKIYRSFIISVFNATSGLVFNALAFGKLIVPLPSGKTNYAKYATLFAATLLDLANYPRDFFITVPPKFLTSTVNFPK
jgi:hypothetical protein